MTTNYHPLGYQVRSLAQLVHLLLVEIRLRYSIQCLDHHLHFFIQAGLVNLTQHTDLKLEIVMCWVLLPNIQGFGHLGHLVNEFLNFQMSFSLGFFHALPYYQILDLLPNFNCLQAFNDYFIYLTSLENFA